MPLTIENTGALVPGPRAGGSSTNKKGGHAMAKEKNTKILVTRGVWVDGKAIKPGTTLELPTPDALMLVDSNKATTDLNAPVHVRDRKGKADKPSTK